MTSGWKYEVVLVESTTGKVVHREPPMRLDDAHAWVMSWESGNCGIVAMVWPTWATAIKSVMLFDTKTRNRDQD